MHGMGGRGLLGAEQAEIRSQARVLRASAHLPRGLWFEEGKTRNKKQLGSKSQLVVHQQPPEEGGFGCPVIFLPLDARRLCSSLPCPVFMCRVCYLVTRDNRRVEKILFKKNNTPIPAQQPPEVRAGCPASSRLPSPAASPRHRHGAGESVTRGAGAGQVGIPPGTAAGAIWAGREPLGIPPSRLVWPGEISFGGTRLGRPGCRSLEGRSWAMGHPWAGCWGCWGGAGS